MKKVKILKAYGDEWCDYCNKDTSDWDITDWEEVSDADYKLLQNWITDKNWRSKNTTFYIVECLDGVEKIVSDYIEEIKITNEKKEKRKIAAEKKKKEKAKEKRAQEKEEELKMLAELKAKHERRLIKYEQYNFKSNI